MDAGTWTHTLPGCRRRLRPSPQRQAASSSQGMQQMPTAAHLRRHSPLPGGPLSLRCLQARLVCVSLVCTLCLVGRCTSKALAAGRQCRCPACFGAGGAVLGSGHVNAVLHHVICCAWLERAWQEPWLAVHGGAPLPSAEQQGCGKDCHQHLANSGTVLSDACAWYDALGK